tara:strand:+ start:4599 stop:4787 length:189 start_codon:yes stop_codon:yes gene_type:complete
MNSYSLRKIQLGDYELNSRSHKVTNLENPRFLSGFGHSRQKVALSNGAGNGRVLGRLQMSRG